MEYLDIPNTKCSSLQNALKGHPKDHRADNVQLAWKFVRL